MSFPTTELFDAHLHIIDPRFPLVANQGYVPDAFTVEDYLERVSSLGVRGGAVVSGSFQGFDQNYLVDALGRLGDGFAGVTQLPATVTDEEVLRLDAAGVRAVRFNLYRGGAARRAWITWRAWLGVSTMWPAGTPSCMWTPRTCPSWRSASPLCPGCP